MFIFEDDLEKIYKSFVRLLIPSKPKSVYKVIVNQALQLVSAEYGSILLANPDGSFKKVYTNIPKDSKRVKPKKKGDVYTTFAYQKLQVISQEVIKSIHPEFNSKQIKSIILIPISFNKVSIGVLSLQSTQKGHFNQKRMRLLKLYGSMAALKIKNSQLFDETQKALETRDLFLSMASHELKTPITTISAYSQLIYSARVTANKQVKPEWAENLSLEVNRLTKLIRELLDVDHIWRGKFEYQMVELSPLFVIKQAQSNFSHLFPSQKLVIKSKIKKKTRILGDRDKLLQVIENILTNAEKFSFRGSAISMNVSETDQTISIAVTNEGSEINTTNLPRIFERFYKTNSKTPGMGLGLYISKTIMNDHHGMIYASSNKPRETTFTIELPKLP